MPWSSTASTNPGHSWRASNHLWQTDGQTDRQTDTERQLVPLLTGGGERPRRCAVALVQYGLDEARPLLTRVERCRQRVVGEHTQSRHLVDGDGRAERAQSVADSLVQRQAPERRVVRRTPSTRPPTSRDIPTSGQSRLERGRIAEGCGFVVEENFV